MKRHIIVILLFCMMVLTAWNNNNTSPNAVYRKISAEDAYQMMQDTNDYILLDVRTGEEFNEKHIKGAVLIPDYEIKSRAATAFPDKNCLILVYCRSGRRSANAANELVKMEYTNVYDFGGIIDWPYGTAIGKQSLEGR